MARVRYTADGGHYRIGGYGFDPGDEKDVDDDVAEHLEDHDDFDVTGELEDEGTDDPVYLSDKGERLGDLTVSEVESALAAGEFDGSLDLLVETESEGEDRKGVYDAIDQRRDELEG